jgi:hypothetical protein
MTDASHSLACIPGHTGPHMMQAAFVVDNIEAAAALWTKTTGVGPFLHIPHIQLVELNYRGEPSAPLDFSAALAQSGGIQIELLQQHCDTPSAYRDTIAKGTQGFHHFGIYTAEYDTARQHYLDLGHAIAVEGKFGAMRFCYIDTSAALGCMIELVEEDAGQTAFFTRVAEAARDWDGVTDPIRPGFPD